ncbi:predicted protein [Naegleria gruberi]|uniref:Predicted protein n=1 Tax=Naegleria gruberi TaxID=5762 RepID=D2VNA6_NAEGR|nr:uncharacterized protein NAEGRDRAFT_70428 [Naegleria gruberi]EFC41619.1 predicted protein [Naegleria gruberi]|eukprot:XP_002674363.1 predicted protein [Naegleria gruberi strain NEG-M]
MEEEIIGTSANINSVVLLVQHKKSKRTRIFIREPKNHLSKVYNTHNIDGIEWREVLDLETLLLDGEWIITCSCSWATVAFVTSFGRILTIGSNHKGELGRPSTKFDNAGECEIVSKTSSNKPFFVKTKSGEYDLLALTKDGKVYRCGYSLGLDGTLERLTEFDSQILDEDEVYEDIAFTARRGFALTSK